MTVAKIHPRIYIQLQILQWTSLIHITSVGVKGETIQLFLS